MLVVSRPPPPQKKGLRQENWTLGRHRRVGTPAVASVSSAQYGRRESVFGELVRLSENSIFGRKTLKIPGISWGIRAKSGEIRVNHGSPVSP